ncbi:MULTISPECIES: 23S rRNA (adenine(2503)-C(2))-methyltransferase RlmN [Marinomonas]|jgi:23S rRNA (adenine2503-C2)-methyltransferase|uniref:23S rRNA (adenine(2503)-C(2))-methyltransferase RlmN n=1 Tax=Marinomonas TaxID=28253 RepID=UPI001D18757C|nr:23S rRNA (adenine(2503)-C(2))-methyltransferase RlmN [Marinomonas communis]MCC4275010.1 23S rRNA (adenine(2503)-C(2))-methyltransferase RlmN [Marinomonas communis]
MTDTQKVNLLGLSPEKLIEFFESIGEKKFRATQVMKWIHQKGAESFEDMTDVSKKLRAKLENICEIRAPEIVSQNISNDGTRKWIIRTEGGQNNCVEAVLIPDGDRATLCVSSQVGCSLDCSFCSTGKQGFNRNLTAAEIIGQVWIAIKSFGPMDPSGPRRVTNVVMMGMGEPLMNFEPVVDAMTLMMHDNAYGLSKRRVTLSTSGVVPRIYDLVKRTDVSLAISLHAPNNELRNELVPINKKYPIEELLEACQHYLDNLPDKRHITIEYTVMAGVNDQEEHARQLSKLLENLECKINLIPFNPFPHSGYEKPSNNQTRRFQKILADDGYTVTVRTTRGDDIDAACGQLVGDFLDKTRRSQKYIELRQVTD